MSYPGGSSENSPSGPPHKRHKTNPQTPSSQLEESVSTDSSGSPLSPAKTSSSTSFFQSQWSPPGSQSSSSNLAASYYHDEQATRDMASGSSEGAVGPEAALDVSHDEEQVDDVTESSEEELSQQVLEHYDPLAAHLGANGLTMIDFEAIYSMGNDQYVFTHKLGEGTYASVYSGLKVEDMNTHYRQEVAIKVCKNDSQGHNAGLIREIDVVDRLIERPHDNIVFLYEWFDSKDLSATYIISELAPIGDLYRAVRQLNSNGEDVWQPIKPQYCRHLIRGIARGVQHLFSLNISHGDIKLENVVLNWYEPEPNTPQDYTMSRFMRMVPKLTDFNNSKRGQPGAPIMHHRPRCSIYTAAPESWHKSEPYDMKIADVYSVGALLLSMLLACHPFAPSSSCPLSDLTMISTEMKGDRNLIKQLLRPFDYKLKEVLIKLLEPEPQNRITINEFLADNWFTQRMQSQELEERWESTLWKGPPQRERRTPRSREWMNDSIIL